MNVRWLDHTESTTDTARATEYGHGMAVATTHQTAGRGRMDRRWITPPGDGLAITIVVSVRELGSPTFLTRIPLIAAVTLADLIGEQLSDGERVSVKWPNDVLLDGRKVAGILVESLDADRYGIGVGVNVSGVPGGDLAGSATSLAHAGVDVDARDFAKRLTDSVLESLRDIDSPETLDRLTRSLATVGQRVRLELPDGRFVSGDAVGLGSSASLVVRTEAGTDEFVAADVTHLRREGDDTVR